MMTTTLSDMSAKKRPEPSAEEIAAKELVRLAKEQGLSLTGPGGLLKQFTKNVLETALNEEMTEHLGHEKNRVVAGRVSTDVRNGARPKPRSVDRSLFERCGSAGPDVKVPSGLKNRECRVPDPFEPRRHWK